MAIITVTRDGQPMKVYDHDASYWEKNGWAREGSAPASKAGGSSSTPKKPVAAKKPVAKKVTTTAKKPAASTKKATPTPKTNTPKAKPETYDGQGGPGPAPILRTPGGIPEEGVQYNFNMDEGDSMLVKFSDDPTPADPTDDGSTVWLFDKKNKTYRPFLSMEALQNSMQPGYSIQDITSKIRVLDSTALQSESFQGKFLPTKYGVQPDGSLPDYSTDKSITGGSDASLLRDYYGGKRAGSDVETNVANILGVSFTNGMTKNVLSKETLENHLFSGPEAAENIARYVSAVLYGGYTFGDVWRDLKAKELSDGGDTRYDNFKAFDETLSASQWYRTEEGKNSKKDASISPPIDILGMTPDFFENPLFKIPGAAFQSLIPPIDMSSPEFREEAEQIQAGWYDIMMQMASAETEQAKTLAEDNWNTFQKNLDTKYGIQLSGNSREAWSQLQKMFAGETTRGLAGTGIAAEARDKYLSDVRRADDVLRESKISEKDLAQRNYLLNTASGDEIEETIASMNAEDAARGLAPDQFRSSTWGLTPSREAQDFFKLENLKQVYPSMSDEELLNIRNQVVDERGRFRSKLYQNYYGAKEQTLGDKRTYQEGRLFDKKTDEERKAYAPFTTPNPFSSYDPGASEASFGRPEPTAPRTPKPKAPVSVSAPTYSMENVPFRKDLTPDADRQSIVSLLNKKKEDQFTDVDRKNLQFATGSTNIPKL